MTINKEVRNSLDIGIEYEDITLLVGKVRALALKITDVRLRQHGVDLKHYAILAALNPAQAPSQRELADYLNVESRRITPQLRSLETKGFISRAPGEDRRSHTIRLTEAGKIMLRECQEVVATAEAEYLNPLTDEQRSQLREGLLTAARSQALDYNLIS